MKTPKSFWPFGIGLTLAGFLGGILTLAIIASSHPADLVSQNYYEQEIAYQTRIDARERARLSGAKITPETAARRVVIVLPAVPAFSDAGARVQLYRPSASGLDQEIPLAPGPDHTQVIDTSRLRPGLWKVRVSWTAEGRDYLLECTVTNLAVSTGAIARH